MRFVRFFSGHDSNSRNRDVQTFGQQPPECVIRFTVNRRCRQPHLQSALVLTFDCIPARARRDPH
jgi:hypothetical protein